MERNLLSLKSLLAVSLVVAGVAFISAASGGLIGIRVGFWLAVLWIILFGIAVVRHRTRGLWLLLGAPLALYWILVFLYIGWLCAHDIRACP